MKEWAPSASFATSGRSSRLSPRGGGAGRNEGPVWGIPFKENRTGTVRLRRCGWRDRQREQNCTDQKERSASGRNCREKAARCPAGGFTLAASGTALSSYPLAEAWDNEIANRLT